LIIALAVNIWAACTKPTPQSTENTGVCGSESVNLRQTYDNCPEKALDMYEKADTLKWVSAFYSLMRFSE